VFSLRDILQIAVQLENNGEKVYRQAAAKSNQGSLCAFMAWMADQEAAHARWFERMRPSVAQDSDDAELLRMGRELLEEVVGGHSFSLDDLDLSRIDKLEELIRVSIEFEKDTALFYEMLAAFVQDQESRSLLEQIIAEEHRHVRMLEEFLGN
jgi:rubrerythrin